MRPAAHDQSRLTTVANGIGTRAVCLDLVHHVPHCFDKIPVRAFLFTRAYPLLRFGRCFVLKLLGKGPISSPRI
jgi:hypothetical protein